MKKTKFGNFVDSKAAAIGLSKGTLVSRLGIPTSTYYSWRNNPANCPQYALKRLAEVLHLDDAERAELLKF